MANTYTLIASNTLSSSAASVTFSAIPNTYTDLVLKISVRNSAAFDWAVMTLEFNGDTSSLYSYTLVGGDGSTTLSARGSGAGSAANYISVFNSASTTSNTFSNIEFYIPSYTVSQNKPYSVSMATENNATLSYVRGYAGLYRSTSALTSIKLTPETNFVSGSSFFLYGIKNS